MLPLIASTAHSTEVPVRPTKQVGKGESMMRCKGTCEPQSQATQLGMWKIIKLAKVITRSS